MAENLAEEEELTGQSLDDTLAATLKEIESRGEEAEEPEAKQAEMEAEAPAESEGAPAEAQGSGEPEQAAQEPEQPETEQPEEAESKPQEGPKRPPGSWSAKGKAEFAKLPEHIQDEVLKRESDFHKGLEQYKEKAQIGERMSQVVQPYEPFLRAKGAKPEQAVASMLNTAYVLETGSPEEKAQALAQTAQQYGVDLSQFNQEEQGQQKDPYIQQLEQKIHQLENNFQTQAQAAQQQTMSEAYSSIDAFRDEVDEQGNAKHLYFDDVRDDMADMIEAAERKGQKLSLQDAYDAAVWARSDIRESLLAQQQQQAEEARKAEAAQKAADAKRRASVNVSTTGSYSGAETSQPGSIDDTLRAKYQEIQTRDE